VVLFYIRRKGRCRFVKSIFATGTSNGCENPMISSEKNINLKSYAVHFFIWFLDISIRNYSGPMAMLVQVFISLFLPNKNHDGCTVLNGRDRKY